ncbi:MAG TPA: hypothetical protein VEF33_04735 [Syntrophales bacterium]|nr:hypothetical protein [Syntrophales bacterium]
MKELKKLFEIFERSPKFKDIQKVLIVVADNLKKIPIKRRVQDTPSILLIGEIFVRHDDLSRQFLVEKQVFLL